MKFHPQSVLVIDDDRDVREALMETLEDFDIVAVGADGGAAALERLRAAGAELPALILLDLRMAGMSGADFRRAQLEDPNLAAIPVIVVSADSHPRDPGLPADGYLRKPLRIDDLLATVRRYIPGKHEGSH